MPTPRKLKPVVGAEKLSPWGAGCTTGSGRSERMWRKAGSCSFSEAFSFCSPISSTRTVAASSRSGRETSKCEAEME